MEGNSAVVVGGMTSAVLREWSFHLLLDCKLDRHALCETLHVNRAAVKSRIRC